MSKTIVKHVSILTLALMTVASVVSLRGLPMMAAEGLTMFFYIAFAAFIFLLPASLIAAELGSAFADQGGGVYTWVKAAFGSRLGFTAIWLQWIQNIVWYPTVLGYAAACLAYLFMKPELANNGTYTGIVIFVVYWFAILVALKGSSAVNTVSKYGVVLGTLFPGIMIIILGALWADQGNPIAFLDIQVVTETAKSAVKTVSESSFHTRFLPHISGLGSLAFLAGIVLLFAGVEVQAVQVSDMENPKRDFPLAMFLAAIIIILLFIMGSLAVAAVIPAKDISLTAGLMQSFQVVFDKFNLNFFTPIMGLLMAFGAIGGVMSWVTGPSRGLIATAKEGEIPPILAKINKTGAPVTMLYIQGIIVSILASLYLIMNNVSVAFFILSAMTATLYLIMYMLMFASAIYLRITKPDLPRSFKIPGGIVGISFIGALGFLGVLFGFIVAFFPPTNLPIGNPSLYVALVSIGTVGFTAIAFIIQAMKKDSWKQG